MLVQKTEKARLELKPGARSLSQKERSLLLLANGHTSMHDLGAMFEGEGEQIVLRLVSQGYLAVARPAAATQALNAAPASKRADEASAPASASPGVTEPRSLGATRMFLFDLCERSFAGRDPEMASRFRQALRDARERESMLAAGHQMLAEIERLAGRERAQAIRERIDMLLPV